MVMKLDQLVNGAINVGFGAAAVAVEGGKKVLDDLGTKGEQVRKDAGTPDIARSVSDMFEQAGGTISDLTERLGMQGETAAQRVLDELILARVRVMAAPEQDMDELNTRLLAGFDEVLTLFIEIGRAHV